MNLVLVLFLVALVCGIAGTVKAIAGVYLSRKRLSAMPMALAGIVLSLSPLFLGVACMFLVAKLHHLRLED
jgi:hypothetical protein